MPTDTTYTTFDIQHADGTHWMFKIYFPKTQDAYELLSELSDGDPAYEEFFWKQEEIAGVLDFSTSGFTPLFGYSVYECDPDQTEVVTRNWRNFFQSDIGYSCGDVTQTSAAAMKAEEKKHPDLEFFKMAHAKKMKVHYPI